jgi:hypothetical protein
VLGPSQNGLRIRSPNTPVHLSFIISNELKNLVETLGGLVIVENNQPKFVVMSYDKFNGVIHKSVDNSTGSLSTLSGNRSVDNSGNFAQDGSEEITDRLNKEILALKEQVAEKERELLGNL